MLTLCLLLTIAALYMEIRFVRRVSILDWALAKFKLLSLVFSLFVSIMLGHLFGAAGVIVFVAGVLSTMLAQVYYNLQRSGQLDRWRKAYIDRKEDIRRKIDQIIRVVKLLAWIAMIPLRIASRMLDIIDGVMDFIETRRRFANRNST